MCGLVALVMPIDRVVDPAELAALRDSLTHRGPDAAGQWNEGHIGLGHRRLAVLDTSDAGVQPMSSPSGRYQLVFNGEIYNFQALRTELPDYRYRSRTDTEVLAHAIEHWGFVKTLDRLVGMFAIAAFDRSSGTLWLARDRLGIKPLYYGRVGTRFLCTSELHAVHWLRDSSPEIDPDALTLLLRHNHIPAPYSVFKGMQKLRPGHYLRLDTLQSHSQPELGCYWSAEPKPVSEAASEAEWVERFRDSFEEAIRCRMVSDVPMGAFLSGGIDSSLVVAAMQAQTTTPVRTFTIGFDDPALNEAEHAAAIAAHLGTEHTEYRVSDADVLALVEGLPTLLDEPFADASLLPTHLLCRLTRGAVTVALSGDGGDELFWGYARYPLRERFDRQRRRIPGILRPAVARLLGSNALAATLEQLPTPRWFGRRSRLRDKLSMASDMLAEENPLALYRVLMSLWKQPTNLLPGSTEPDTIYTNPPPWLTTFPSWRQMNLVDLLTYLPDDCLTKVDRASMGVGLEARVPLLDHRLVELAYQLPPELVRDKDQGKVLLRRLLAERLPAKLTERPKAGFGVPLGKWLNGPLADLAGDLLSTERLRKDGLLDPVPITRLWDAHRRGDADWSAYLWNVLVLQLWRSAPMVAGRRN